MEINEADYANKKAGREASLIRVQERRTRLANNIDDWMQQILGKVELATTALDLFETDDPKEQRNVCARLGWNWTLQDKNLCVTRHKWFSKVVDLKNHLEAKKGTLEPIKTYMEFKKSDAFEGAHLILRGLCDAIRTESAPSHIP